MISGKGKLIYQGEKYMSPYIIHADNRIAHFLDIATVAVGADLLGNHVKLRQL